MKSKQLKLMEENNEYYNSIKGKEKQILFSWLWFYGNDLSNLQYSRYPKSDYNCFIMNTKYSARYKEDQLKAKKVWNKIRKSFSNERQG